MLGAVERVRPKMMTVAAIMAGLLPIMWSTGTGSEVMQRIAVPMIGGMVSSTVLTLIVIPAIYALVKGFRLPARSGRRLGPKGEPTTLQPEARRPKRHRQGRNKNAKLSFFQADQARAGAYLLDDRPRAASQYDFRVFCGLMRRSDCRREQKSRRDKGR